MIKISQKIILGIVASIMFIVPMLGIPHALAASTTGIMIPLYSYPTSTAWSNVIAAKNAHPSVPIVAIINPNSGPGTSQNQAFVTGIQKLKDAGIIVLGYIPTKYAVRSSASVMHDIDSYKSWYAVDGVKFDEMTNTVGYETYYSNLSDYAKSIGLAMTVGNPGADVPPSYIGIVDNLTIFENGFLPTLSYLGGWHTNYDKSNFSSESYAIPTLDQTYVSSASQYLGYIYLTDDNLPNPWDTTSSYLNTLAATLDVEPAPTPVA
ncbi:MAG TPA: spherulation-specific family 4 protein, partial [Nitrosopumilaceae archaeon]|nr:spherulation-specific family 4 protein [Nitrosopumilaceae archaeon]